MKQPFSDGKWLFHFCKNSGHRINVNVPKSQRNEDARADIAKGVHVNHFVPGVAAEIFFPFKMPQIVHRHFALRIAAVLQPYQSYAVFFGNHEIAVPERFKGRFDFTEPGFLNAKPFEKL